MNYKLVITFLVLLTCGCMKDEACAPVNPASEEEKIKTFIASNGITAIRHSSGIFYQIVSSGWGPAPTGSSHVTVTFVGKLLDGSIFDHHSNVKKPLNGFIEGWEIGLPLIQKGGTIRLIIPSAYAYGCTRNGNIPPNSVLYFEIQLLDIH